MTNDPDRRILLVHAHPDDECIGTGATMARYVDEGVGVTLVTCTAGEMGEVLVPELSHLAYENDGGLGEHRRGELDEAMKVLGVTDHRFLGGFGRFHDSGMAWHADGHAIPAEEIPDNAFWNADLTEAADELVKVIRELRPQVLVTYDQFGNYGHPDHIQAHRVAMYAAQLAAVPSYRLDLGEPHDIAKIYWTAMSESRMRESLRERLESFGNHQKERLDQVALVLTKQTETLETRLEAIRSENAKKLEEMRQTVDEKLHGTLEKRLGESFQQVSDKLEAVHKGLGEMQNLASGVGDLKRVLTNVKARGGWGEVQLGRQIEDMLTRDQYEVNAAVNPATQDRVEYAVKLPGRSDGEFVFLPIDAKFPQEDYERLLAAQESGTAEEIEAAGKQIEAVVKAQAKTISEKYIAPPSTTDFAIMYLPTEGLFAEVIRRPGLTFRSEEHTSELQSH